MKLEEAIMINDTRIAIYNYASKIQSLDPKVTRDEAVDEAMMLWNKVCDYNFNTKTGDSRYEPGGLR